MYAKSHSYGEYVFDHGWAQAFERAGGNYYPKLQVAAPFSPVPGPRLLRRPDAGVSAALLGRALAQACRELDVSSVHVTFCTEAEWHALGESRLAATHRHAVPLGQRRLCAPSTISSPPSPSRKRKTIRRERRDANAAGLEFVTLRGAEIGRREWDRRSTASIPPPSDRKWGSAYLTRQFFHAARRAAGRSRWC